MSSNMSIVSGCVQATTKGIFALPAELIDQISIFATPKELRKLSCTSSGLRYATEVVRFTNVDLSIHNSTTFQAPMKHWPGHFHTAADPNRPIDSADRHLYRRQIAFVRTILAKPWLAKHIRTLKWTFLSTEEGIEEGFGNPIYADGSLMEALALCNKVQVLDLAFMRGRQPDSFTATKLPSTMFHRVRHLTLGGSTSQTQIDSIIASLSSELITDLSINNLSVHDRKAAVRTATQATGLFDTQTAELGTCAAGDCTCMQRSFPIFPDMAHLRFPRLMNLSYTGPAQATETCKKWHASHEINRYFQIGRFLTRVRTSLRTFTFCHAESQIGPDAIKDEESRRMRVFKDTDAVTVRPADTRFLDLVLPRLVSEVDGSAAAWEKLERVSIRGIGCWPDYTWGMDGTDYSLKMVVGEEDVAAIKKICPDVQVTVEEEGGFVEMPF